MLKWNAEDHVTKEYQDKYIPKAARKNMPTPFSSLFDEECAKMSRYDFIYFSMISCNKTNN